MIKILCENAYEASIWYKNIYKGLTGELKKRRISYEKSESTDDITETDTVYIIGSGYVWMNSAILECNKKNITPVLLCNQASKLVGGKYHCVTTDTSAYIRHIISSLNADGITQIALYGVNESSVSDGARMKSFLEILWTPDSIYMNNGSLKNCFLRFIQDASKYEAVICVNNYAAISLAKNLSKAYPEILEKLKIVSCTSGKLETAYSKHISFVSMNFEQYGKAALSVSEMAIKNPYISGITVAIQWNYGEGNISASIAPDTAENVKADMFYDDKEVQRLIAAENLLSECDDTDIEILKLLAAGEIYDEIAEKCFLSKESVKYRIKKYMSICGVGTRAEMLEIMQDFYPFTASGEMS